MQNNFSSGFLPVFDKKIIRDHNAEGFDSVDSEDFEAGFGCVVDTSYPVLPPPEIRQHISEEEKKRRDYFYMTEHEKQRREDEFLAEHGIF